MSLRRFSGLIRQRLLPLVAATATLVACAGFSQAATVPSGRVAQREFTQLMQREARPADEYVVGKFKDHDVVFLGEGHYVQQNLQFVQSLIPKLYVAGVYTLGYEMLNAMAQNRLDWFVQGGLEDDGIADDLIFDWRLEHVPFKEYADVLRAARDFNRTLPVDARKFRILALDVSIGVTDESLLRPGQKGDRKAMESILGGRWDDRRDMQWAEIIARQVIHKGDKALIYAGAGHTTTSFFQYIGTPTYRAFHWRTAGNIVYNQIGERAIRILLHGTDAEAQRYIDPWMRAFQTSQSDRPIGFDIRQGTVVGDVPVKAQGYLPPTEKFGPARADGFTLAHVTDGYVFLAPRAHFKMVRPIEVNDRMLGEYLRRKRIETGDPGLSFSREELAIKINEQYERRRTGVENPNVE